MTTKEYLGRVNRPLTEYTPRQVQRLLTAAKRVEKAERLYPQNHWRVCEAIHALRRALVRGGS